MCIRDRVSPSALQGVVPAQSPAHFGPSDEFHTVHVLSHFVFRQCAGKKIKKRPEAVFHSFGTEISAVPPKDCRLAFETAPRTLNAGTRDALPPSRARTSGSVSVAPPHPAGPGSQSVTRILWRPSWGTVCLIAFVCGSIAFSMCVVYALFSQMSTLSLRRRPIADLAMRRFQRRGRGIKARGIRGHKARPDGAQQLRIQVLIFRGFCFRPFVLYWCHLPSSHRKEAL